MAKREISKKHKDELLELIAIAAKDKQLLDATLKDLLTPAEYRELTTRWQIVKRLAMGEGHRIVAHDLKVGISTVARGSRMLANALGGFNQLLQKISRKL